MSNLRRRLEAILRALGIQPEADPDDVEAALARVEEILKGAPVRDLSSEHDIEHPHRRRDDDMPAAA